MVKDIALKWDRKYQSKENLSGKPSYVLTSNLHYLPQNGKALDLACGPGGNAELLAKQGLDTFAWDISRVALAHLEQNSTSKKLNIKTELRDVNLSPPEPESFDVIVVSNFLERRLVPALIAALKPNGIIYYQTFTREGARTPPPKNPLYKLDKNELICLFSSLTIRFYREDGENSDDGEVQGIAMLLAQKDSNSSKK
jgi:tellurite methyltransferase